MSAKIFLNEVKECLYGWRRGSLPMPGKLYRSMRQGRREIKRNDSSSWGINDRLREDRNSHTFRDKCPDRADISTFKHDLWAKTCLLCQMQHNLAQAGSRLEATKLFYLSPPPRDQLPPPP